MPEMRYEAVWLSGSSMPNARVADTILNKTVCELSPMAMAQRIAFSLTILEHFSNNELEKMARAIERK